jgi:hypothetical protein
MKFCLYLLGALACCSTLLSCDSQKSTTHTTTSATSTISPDSLRSWLERQENARALHVSALSADSTFTGVYITPRDSGSNSYFYSDTAIAMYVARYKTNGSSLTCLQRTQLDSTSWTYVDIDSSSLQTLTIDGKPYFHFATQQTYMGKAVLEQMVLFYLVDMDAGKGYTLTYTGLNDFKCEECINGSFTAKNEWKGPAGLYDTLIALSSKSKLIYHPGSEDADPYAWQNYESKWEKNNQADNIFGAGHASLTIPIHTTYYTTNLFALNKGSVTDSVENEHYTVVSYFRSNLIGYDKQKRLYFPIVIEGCNYDCNKALQLDEASKLLITYEDEETQELSITSDLVFDATTGK